MRISINYGCNELNNNQNAWLIVRFLCDFALSLRMEMINKSLNWKNQWKIIIKLSSIIWWSWFKSFHLLTNAITASERRATNIYSTNWNSMMIFLFVITQLYASTKWILLLSSEWVIIEKERILGNEMKNCHKTCT